VSGGGCCPLACRHGHVCVGRVVVSPCCFMHVSPSFSCASAWSHSCLLPILRVGAHRQMCCLAVIIVVVLFKKKKLHFLLRL
jgi:hypothetical protein